MWHMKERFPDGHLVEDKTFPLLARMRVQPRGLVMPKYALTHNSMAHMKEFEENPGFNRSGQHLQTVLARSRSAPGAKV